MERHAIHFNICTFSCQAANFLSNLRAVIHIKECISHILIDRLVLVLSKILSITSRNDQFPPPKNIFYISSTEITGRILNISTEPVNSTLSFSLELIYASVSKEHIGLMGFTFGAKCFLWRRLTCLVSYSVLEQDILRLLDWKDWVYQIPILRLILFWIF